MSETYDVLVIGAGHNGLSAAVALAGAGRRVLVVEAGRQPGGLAARDEFHPGYRSAGLLQDSSGVRAPLVRPLGLEQHGLKWRERRAPVLALGDDHGFWVDADPDRGRGEIAPLSSRDAERYHAYRKRLAQMRPALASFLDRPPLDVVEFESNVGELLRRGLGMRRLGREVLLELMRVPPQPVADWLSEWFETPRLLAALALPAVAGMFAGPRSPGTSTNLLLAEGAAGPGIVGDGPALIDALERQARSQGVEIRCDSPVRTVLPGTAGPRVVLESGDEIHGRAVAASCNPRSLLLDLLPPGAIPALLESRIRAFRCRGTTGQVLFAVSTPPRFAGRSDAAVEFARTGNNLDELERAFDAVKYDRLPERPILEIHVPTVSDPGLAPTGHAVVAVLVHFVPYTLDGGWDDAGRERLGDRVQEIVESHAPGFAGSIVGRVVRTPVDLERRYGLPGGQIHHGEHALDQLLVRPTPECSGYRTPVPGVWLCGGGSHPGGGLSCAPGLLAARAIAAS